MISDGLNRKQRIEIREEIGYHQQKLVELVELLPELKQIFESSALNYERARTEFSEYL